LDRREFFEIGRIALMKHPDVLEAANLVVMIYDGWTSRADEGRHRQEVIVAPARP
jgi:hypothetical protein